MRNQTFAGEASSRWPNIERYLSADSDSAGAEFLRWFYYAEHELSPDVRAASYDEWADYVEWLLVRRLPELVDDRAKHHLVAVWTDSMAYCCRRSAAWARGEDPGAWQSQSMRRPDLCSVRQTIATVTGPTDRIAALATGSR